VESRIANFRKDSEKYSSVDGGTEMQKYIVELEDMYEDVAEALKHRMVELENELERTENYSTYYQVFMLALRLHCLVMSLSNCRSNRICIILVKNILQKNTHSILDFNVIVLGLQRD